ncbi:MAG: 3-hydroxyacyl-CoA dehydrogenase family protein [Halothermotrichaceae bacterium]
MQKVGVVGAGTMGSGIAQCFITSGYNVVLNDINSDYLRKAINKINNNLNYLVTKEKMTEIEKNEIIDRLEWSTDLSKLAGTDLIIEAVSENMSSKIDVFKQLEKICNDRAIFASNTSALSITEIAANIDRKEKVLGIHFFNPAPVMKLVELIITDATSETTLQTIKKLFTTIGKEVVEIEESPGFIVNRLLIPMINEAIFLLYEGIADKEDIDSAMKYGANHPLGPLTLADLIGLDICLMIMDTFYLEFRDSKYRACPLLRKKVRAGELGRKTGKGFYAY